MVCAQILGNDTTISVAGLSGHFELNVFKPVMINALLQSATLIADGAGAHLMKTGAVQWLIVGADRICANGDTANKIGTYHHAIAAKHHGVKVMVVAPSSTVDMQTENGDLIHIEERDPAELLSSNGKRTVAEGVQAFNPVFDVTPADLIDAIVTEKGLIERPNLQKMTDVFLPKSSA